jgi:hypothetical protein
MYHRYSFTVLQVYINLMSKVTNITITLNILVYGQKHYKGNYFNRFENCRLLVTSCLTSIKSVRREFDGAKSTLNSVPVYCRR